MAEGKRRAILMQFAETRTQTISGLSDGTGVPITEVKQILNELKDEGAVAQHGRSGWLLLLKKLPDFDNPLIPQGVVYMDYMNVVSRLRYAYRNGMNAMLIGVAGIGKTAAIRKVAEMEQVPMITTVFSRRTTEHKFWGRLDTRPDGTLYFKKGDLLRALENGWIWYADELNQGEADCLIKTDSALDHRKSAEVEGEYIKAGEGFWATCSINPLDRYHPGTKELPGQLIRRYPVRIHMTYPDPSTEYNIVKMHVPQVTTIAETFMQYIFAMNQLRENPDLNYHPSPSESINLARLLTTGVNDREALKMTLIDVYGQWGEAEMVEVAELLKSRLNIEFDLLTNLAKKNKTNKTKTFTTVNHSQVPNQSSPIWGTSAVSGSKQSNNSKAPGNQLNPGPDKRGNP